MECKSVLNHSMVGKPLNKCQCSTSTSLTRVLVRVRVYLTCISQYSMIQAGVTVNVQSKLWYVNMSVTLCVQGCHDVWTANPPVFFHTRGVIREVSWEWYGSLGKTPKSWTTQRGAGLCHPSQSGWVIDALSVEFTNKLEQLEVVYQQLGSGIQEFCQTFYVAQGLIRHFSNRRT